MNFTDKILTCSRCYKVFAFTAGEQRFFAGKAFLNLPKLCKPCKAIQQHKSPIGLSEFHVVCADCGAQTTVPFEPKQNRPVLCRACFEQSRLG